MNLKISRTAFSILLILGFVACESNYTNETADYQLLKKREQVEEKAPFFKIEPNSANTESYSEIVENDFKKVKDASLSTFGIDVDAASYSNTRRFLTQGTMPPTDAVRIEEFVNYFNYDYPQPTDEHPFSITTEISECPWNADHRLAHIGLKGKEINVENLPQNNLVFLLDVSGSMNDPLKLPLLKDAFRMLVDNLRPEDRVAIVVYAGAAGVVLPSTPGSEKETILNAIYNLEAGGSTAGGQGIKAAYKIALQNLIEDGNNRVILATDGDFNVGISSDEGLVDMIEKRRDQGVFLTVLGFGTGNLQDSKMEKLADNGNGNYAYIDNLNEAKKVLITEMSGTLLTIAKDVKLQLEFDKKYVESYRLVGYENRLLKDEEFDDDKKDSGDMGAGHTVTALYEIIPKKKNKTDVEYFNIKMRYKQPESSTSQLLEVPAIYDGTTLEQTSNNYRFSAAVASFGMLLRDSQHKGDANYSNVIQWAKASKGADLNGYREEFIGLVELANIYETREGLSVEH